MFIALKSIALTTLAMAASAVVVGALAYRQFGSGAYTASFIAAAAVWAVGCGAIFLSLTPRSPANRINGALAAVLVRTGALLVAMIACTKFEPTRLGPGFLGMLLSHYLVGLVVETVLVVRAIRRRDSLDNSPVTPSAAPV